MIRNAKPIKKRKPPRIKPASAKGRARSLQQWVCKRIAAITGFEYGKDCPIESRPMGQSGVDAVLEKAVLEKFPFSVECKNQETWGVPGWIKDARDGQKAHKKQTKMETDWLLFMKRNDIKPVVMMDAERFFEIFEKVMK